MVEVLWFFPRCPWCGRGSVPDRPPQREHDWAYRCTTCRHGGLPLRFRFGLREGVRTAYLVGWYG